MSAVELSTRRFVLRDFTDADAEAFVAYHDDARIREFAGAGESTPEHARELVALFRSWAAQTPRMNHQLAIVQRAAPHALVGCCGLRRANAEPGTADLGIELAPAVWGRHAYALEVMRALAQFGFEELELLAIRGDTVSANARATRLLAAVGATANELPTPAWMAGKGWKKVGWRINRQQWERLRATRALTPGWRARTDPAGQPE